MNKSKLAEIIAKSHGISKAEAERIVDTTFSSIIVSLSKEETVDIYGFGKFEVRHRSAREGINPATKEKIQIAASKVPSFKASKKLKAAVK